MGLGKIHRQGALDEPATLHPREDRDAGVHPARGHPRRYHDRHPRGGERLPRPAGRHDHRGDLSGRGHRHGRPPPDEGLHPRREHRPDRGLDRRVRGRRGHLHHPGLPDGRRLDELQHVRCLHQVDAPDVRRRPARHPVRHVPPAGHGHRPRPPLPGIPRRGRDPQGRTEGQRGRQVPLPGHGHRLPVLRPRRRPAFRRQQGFHPEGREDRDDASSAWAPRRPLRSSTSAGPWPSPAPASTRPIWASATSSARASRRSTSPAASSPGGSSRPCSCTSSAPSSSKGSTGRARTWPRSPGRTWSPTSGSSSSGPSPSAACSSAPDIRSTRCGRTSPPGSSGPWATSRRPPARPRSPRASRRTSTSRSSCSGSWPCSS